MTEIVRGKNVLIFPTDISGKEAEKEVAEYSSK